MRRSRIAFGAAFLAPALLLYSALVFLPIIASVFYSLSNWRTGRTPSFVGLQNYTNLFQDPQYWTVAFNSFALVTAAVLVQVPLALVLAYLLHLVGRGYRIYRSLMFLPVIIAPVAVGIAFMVFYNGDIGAFNEILEVLGLGGLKRNWLADSGVVLWAVNVPVIWQYVGLYTIIFVAAIRGIPNEIFEAAALDGSSRARMLPYIVIPQIREVIVICMILAATGAIRAFDHSWVMAQGGPGQASSYFATMIYKTAFFDGRLGYATAISVTLLVYISILVVVVRKLFLRGA